MNVKSKSESLGQRVSVALLAGSRKMAVSVPTK
jgi:hypothetical protein